MHILYKRSAVAEMGDRARAKWAESGGSGNWTTRGYANSRTGQLEVQSASRPVRELAIRELAYPRVVQ